MNGVRTFEKRTFHKFLTIPAIFIIIAGYTNVMASTSIENVTDIDIINQSISANGTVVDALGDPIIGASVLEKGTTNGTITDINGRFNMNVRQGSTLLISFMGYKSQEIRSASNMRITLVEDSELLDEVVVVGYGTQKKVNLTGAVSTVDVSKTLEARPYSDVARALQGAVPGLTILTTSGQLDEKPTMTIRGTGTLSNSAKSNPLIIVDGVPMEDISFLNTQDIENISVLKDAASSSIYGTRAAFGVVLITTKAAKKTEKVRVNYTNNFAWDTPTILPDMPDVPSQLRALSIANRNMNPNTTPQLFGMNIEDLIPYAEDWKQRNGGKKTGYREMILGEDFYINDNGIGQYYADWDVVGIMYRNWKPSQSHNVTVQGTSGKTSYYLSLGYNNSEGIMNFNPDKLSKYTVNMNVTSEITDWLQVGGRFSFTDRTYSKPNVRQNVYEYLWRWGSFFSPLGTYNGVDMQNPIAYLKQAGDDTQKKYYTRVGGFLKAKLLKGLTLNADYTFNVMSGNRNYANLHMTAYNAWGGNLLNGPVQITTGQTAVWQDSERDQSYAFNVYANYEISFLKKHNFNIMLGANAEEGKYRSHWSRKEGLLDPNLPEFNLAEGAQTAGGTHNEWGTAGWFGRINYDYNGIWLAEINGRYDGSSRFPENDRWAFFPSGSLGYRMSEEPYFTPIKEVVSNAKFRGSFGEIGNQAVGSNMYISTLSKRSDADTYWLDPNGVKLTAYNLPSLVSSTLKWERVQTLDVGIDLGFLNNELNASFDWWQRDTKDMLAPGKTMPQTLGAGAPYVNAGSLRTRGWELTIDWRKSFKEFTVYANASIGDFKTVITEWDNETKLLNQNYSGKRYGDIWGFVTDRLYQKDDFEYDANGNLIVITLDESHGEYNAGRQVYKLKGDNPNYQGYLQQGTFMFGPGDIKFKDLDGKPGIDGGAGTADDHGDLTVIGNSTPRYQYSFRLGGEWNGFDIDLFFQGIGKRTIWTQSSFVMPFMRGVDGIYKNQTDYWTEDNTNAYFPRLYGVNNGVGSISVLPRGNHNFYPQTKYLVNMAYLRFKNFTVGYTLPKTLTQKAYLDKVRIYFSANNICELINKNNAPLDPEINKGEGNTDNGTWGRIDPMYRTVSFGLQVTF